MFGCLILQFFQDVCANTQAVFAECEAVSEDEDFFCLFAYVAFPVFVPTSRRFIDVAFCIVSRCSSVILLTLWQTNSAYLSQRIYNITFVTITEHPEKSKHPKSPPNPLPSANNFSKTKK
jgi:hypothetical protein